MNIFISYGHDKYRKIVERIDLDLQDNGYYTWLDVNKIGEASTWDYEIEKGIQEAKCIIAFMTKHAYRRPDGVCLDETYYARRINKFIAPVMIEYINPPLHLARLQYLDMQDAFDPKTLELNEEVYRERFNVLLKCIKQLDMEIFDAQHVDVKKILKPFNYDIDLSIKISDFIGRRKIIKNTLDWLENEHSKVFWIVGEAGCGKSALAAKITSISDKIIGIHFCKYNNKPSSDPKRILASLAYYISSQIKDYYKYIITNVNFMEFEKLSFIEVFNLFFIQALNKIPKQKKKMAVIIDGLDEIDFSVQEQFLLLINHNFNKLPSWFGLILTSRFEKSVLNSLSSIKQTIIKTDDNIKNDMKKIIKKKLNKEICSDTKINEIIEFSEGNFFYIISIINDIKSGILDVKNLKLPRGMSGFYFDYFTRISRRNEGLFKYKIRNILEIVCSLHESINIEFLAEILHEDLYELYETLDELTTILDYDEERIKFKHKSISDWLTNRRNSRQFFIISKKGTKKIVQYIINNSNKLMKNNYLRKYGFLHFFELNEYEKITNILNQLGKKVYEFFYEFIKYKMGDDQDKIVNFFNVIIEKSKDYKILIFKSIRDLVEQGKSLHANWIYNSIPQNKPEFKRELKIFSELIKSRINNKNNILIQKAKELISTIEDRNILPDILYLLADGYRCTGNHKKATIYYNKSIEMSHGNIHSTSYFRSMYSLGDLDYVRGDIKKAFSLAKNLMNMYDKEKEKSKYYRIYRLMGHIHSIQRNSNQAFQYFEKCKKIAQYLKNPYFLAETNVALLEEYSNISKLPKNLLIELRNRRSNESYIISYGKSYYVEAEYLIRIGSHSEALNVAKKGLKIMEKAPYASGIARCNLNIGIAYYKLGKYDESRFYLLKAGKYYKEEEIYPSFRFLSLYYLYRNNKDCKTDKSMKIDKAIKTDDYDERSQNLYNLHESIEDIPYLENFKWLSEKIQEISNEISQDISH